jgi:hypothetical protein
MQSVQRHFGKYMKRSADEKTVSVLLKDFEDADQLLTRIIESSKAWREAWISILTHQARLFNELEGLYQPILGAGPDYQGHEPVETDEHTIARTARMRQECEELKNDLGQDLSMVDTQMIKPAQDAKDHLHSFKKTIKKREDKKLDFERYQNRVDTANKKSKPSDRDRATLTKAEADLSIALEAYSQADENLRQYLPAILTSVFSLLPHILTAQIQIQNTLLGHYYTSISNYCSQEGFPNPAPAMKDVIKAWEQAFKPTQHEAESLPLLASTKMVRVPMNNLTNANGYANGHRRPSAHSTLGQGNRTQSVSPARNLPPSPSYDTKPRISSSPSRPPLTTNGSHLLSPTSEVVASPSPQHSSYTTPMSMTTFAPAGPNMDYFSRDRLPSTTSTHSTSQSHTPYSTTPPSTTPLSSFSASIAKKKPPPPPPPRQPSQTRPPEVWVTALYDFQGQSAGDLSFKEGDRIKVVKAGDSKDDWWTGELRGRKGEFPGNYCE